MQSQYAENKENLPWIKALVDQFFNESQKKKKKKKIKKRINKNKKIF